MPARTESEVRAYLVDLGATIRRMILRNEPVLVRYEPGNGTGYDLLFVPSWATALVSPGPLSDRPIFPPNAASDYDTPERNEHKRMIYLSRLTDGPFASCYPWNWGHAPHVSYVAEKWMHDREVDGAALTLLLAAISETEPKCTLADAHIRVTDAAPA
jgi:hypothetical protein